MKEQMLLLSALCLLIVASCKKVDGTKVKCQMTSVTHKSSSDEYLSILTENYTYDNKGRITKVQYSDGKEVNYSYTSNEIIEESPLFASSSSKVIYQLDASGKILSAVAKFTILNSIDVSSIKYLYNSDGYLSEIQNTYKGEDGTFEGNTVTDKFIYTNGNLTSVVRTIPLPNGGASTITTVIAYTNELVPGNFFKTYSPRMPNTEILKAYFGKVSKNLISEIKNNRDNPGVSYTYEKNAEGNVSQMTLTANSSVHIYGFTYNCK